MNFKYIGNCTSPELAPYLEDMVENEKTISYRSFIREIDVKNLIELFPDYDWGKKKTDLRIWNDYAISYHKSTFNGYPCYYIVQSGIEYIFVPSNYSDEPKFLHGPSFAITKDGRIIPVQNYGGGIMTIRELKNGWIEFSANSKPTEAAVGTLIKYINENNWIHAVISDDEKMTTTEFIDDIKDWAKISENVKRMVDIICESADTMNDLEKKVGNISSKLILYLYNGKEQDYYGFQFMRSSNGHEYAYLRGAQIGLTGEDAKLWFLFGEPEAKNKAASFAFWKNSKEPTIIVCGYDPSDVDQIRSDVIYRDITHRCIEHELVHYIDSFYRDMHKKKYQPDKHPGKYNNSTHELNAYFFNILTPLIRFNNIMKSESDDLDDDARRRMAQRVAERLKIDNDFNKTFENIMGDALKNGFATFIKRLRYANKKALIRKMYVLHQEALKYL